MLASLHLQHVRVEIDPSLLAKAPVAMRRTSRHSSALSNADAFGRFICAHTRLSSSPLTFSSHPDHSLSRFPFCVCALVPAPAPPCRHRGRLSFL